MRTVNDDVLLGVKAQNVTKVKKAMEDDACTEYKRFFCVDEPGGQVATIEARGTRQKGRSPLLIATYRRNGTKKKSQLVQVGVGRKGVRLGDAMDVMTKLLQMVKTHREPTFDVVKAQCYALRDAFYEELFEDSIGTKP